MLNMKRMRKINHLMKRKKRSMVLLPPALVRQTILVFSTMVGFFHRSATSVLMWGASGSSSSSYGHTAPRVLLIILTYFWGQCVLSLIGWDTFLDPTCFMSKIVHLVILAGIPAVLTHLPHLILLAVPLVPLLPIPLSITLDVLVQTVKNMLINTLIPLFPIHSLTFNYNA